MTTTQGKALPRVEVIVSRLPGFVSDVFLGFLETSRRLQVQRTDDRSPSSQASAGRSTSTGQDDYIAIHAPADEFPR